MAIIIYIISLSFIKKNNKNKNFSVENNYKQMIECGTKHFSENFTIDLW